MPAPVELLIDALLQWLAARPRCYGEVMDAWRTSCPRLPVWELAIERGWVHIDHPPRTAMAGCPVVLTEAGRQALAKVPA